MRARVVRSLPLLRQWALLSLSFSSILQASSTTTTHTITLDSNHEQDPLLQWCSAQKDWQRPFLVALLADPQVGFNFEKYNSEELLVEAASHLQRLQPDLILVAGDLIQSPMSNEFQELTTAKTVLEGLNIPYFLTSGNHDLFHHATVEVLDGFAQYWHTPYYWYAVEYSNTLFLMLETNILIKYQDRNSPEMIQQLAQEQLDWIEATLQEATNYDHVVPIAHHPMALDHLDEEETGLNTPRQVRRLLQQLYQSHPKISHIFAGHIHSKAVVQDEAGLNYVAYPATGVVLGQQPPGFALLTLQGKAPLHERYYGYQDLPTTRPDVPDATFTVTFPNGGEELQANSQVCITWTSTSMANRVQLLYSLDNGASWTLIGEGPNVGIYPWRVPSSPSNNTLVAVSSAYNGAIMGASQESNRIVPATSQDSTSNQVPKPSEPGEQGEAMQGSQVEGVWGMVMNATGDQDAATWQGFDSAIVDVWEPSSADSCRCKWSGFSVTVVALIGAAFWFT